MTQICATLQRALQQHQAGNLSAAEQLYRRVLAASPRNADALDLLGVLEHQCGRCESAVEAIRRRLRSIPGSRSSTTIWRPRIAPWPSRRSGRELRTRTEVETGLRRRPQQSRDRGARARPRLPGSRPLPPGPAVFTRLRRERTTIWETALKDLGELAEAERSYRQAIALRPDFALAHNNLGTLFDEHRRPARRASLLRTGPGP